LDTCDEQVYFNTEDSAEIISQLPAGSYIKVFQYDDGEYGLHLCPRLLGGGFWGAAAGCWVGKFVSSAICHGAIDIVTVAVSAVATPVASIAVGGALESIFGAVIETFTTAAAVVGGIAGAVATGPV
jgi:hypothetical protein